MQLPDRCISIEGGCSDAALRPLIFSFFLSFLGIYSPPALRLAHALAARGGTTLR